MEGHVISNDAAQRAWKAPNSGGIRELVKVKIAVGAQ